MMFMPAARRRDLSGQVFGRLTVTEYLGPRGKDHASWWQCRCECGRIREIRAAALIRGLTKSCGCLVTTLTTSRTAEHRRHGQSEHPLYHVWCCIKARCFNPRSKSYRNYGGRGIWMHEPWVNDYTAFISDLESEIGKKPHGASIDRIDNDGPYAPGNVRWATPEQQVNNTRRTIRLTEWGVEMSLKQYAALYGLNYDVLRYRVVNMGLSPNTAARLPLGLPKVRRRGAAAT